MSYQPSLIDETSFKSERLLYRAVDKEDAPLRNRLANNPRVENMVSDLYSAPVSLETTAAKMNPSSSVIYLAVCLPDVKEKNVPGQAIGFIKLCGMREGEPHRVASFSIIFDELYTGKGYGTEALNFLCKIGFMHAGLHRIQGKYLEINKQAAKCYEKVGFQVEGRDRKTFWYNGGWVDLVNFGILEDEGRALNGF